MNMQIKEFAQFSGVSVRTLHYYDEIGLLKPSFVDRSTGYRYYDETSVLRMQEILFYRELDFSLKSIGEILSDPHYDTEAALRQQRKLLELKKKRLEKLICAIDGAMKGENIMKAFDNSEFEKYKEEAKEKWGKTDAYKEHAQKTRGYSKENWNDVNEGLMAVFADFAVCMKNGMPRILLRRRRLLRSCRHISLQTSIPAPNRFWPVWGRCMFSMRALRRTSISLQKALLISQARQLKFIASKSKPDLHNEPNQ